MSKTVYRKIKSLPECDRPRERLMKLGEAALSDRELIAIILGTGTKRTSALDLADLVLSEFQSITDLLKASVDDLCKISGIGPAKAIKVKASLELANRCLTREILIKDRIDGPEDIFRLLRFRFLKEDREHFALVLVNTKNHLLKIEVVSVGSLDSTIVHPREVFSRAIRASCSGVILVHNHPSGDPQPSNDDINLTERLAEAGKILGIRVLDHVIIGDETFYSFSNELLL